MIPPELQEAITCGNLDSVRQYYREKGEDVNARVQKAVDYTPDDSETALLLAIRLKKTAIVEFLLQWGADPQMTSGKRNVFDYAFQYCVSPVILFLLLRYGASFDFTGEDPNRGASFGSLSKYWDAEYCERQISPYQRNQIDTLKRIMAATLQLLKYCQEIPSLDQLQRCEEIIKKLQASISLQSSQGSALQIAMRANNKPLVMLLISSGADVICSYSWHESPATLVRDMEPLVQAYFYIAVAKQTSGILLHGAYMAGQHRKLILLSLEKSIVAMEALTTTLQEKLQFYKAVKEILQQRRDEQTYVINLEETILPILGLAVDSRLRELDYLRIDPRARNRSSEEFLALIRKLFQSIEEQDKLANERHFIAIARVSLMSASVLSASASSSASAFCSASSSGINTAISPEASKELTAKGGALGPMTFSYTPAASVAAASTSLLSSNSSSSPQFIISSQGIRASKGPVKSKRNPVKPKESTRLTKETFKQMSISRNLTFLELITKTIVAGKVPLLKQQLKLLPEVSLDEWNVNNIPDINAPQRGEDGVMEDTNTTAVDLAMANGRLKMVEYLLDNHPVDLTLINFSLAVLNTRREDMLRLLLRKGAFIDSRSPTTEGTALQDAIAHAPDPAHDICAHLLTVAEGLFDLQDGSLTYELEDANENPVIFTRSLLEILQLLGDSLNARLELKGGITALHHAVLSKDLRLALALLRAGADIHMPDSNIPDAQTSFELSREAGVASISDLFDIYDLKGKMETLKRNNVVSQQERHALIAISQDILENGIHFLKDPIEKTICFFELAKLMIDQHGCLFDREIGAMLLGEVSAVPHESIAIYVSLGDLQQAYIDLAEANPKSASPPLVLKRARDKKDEAEEQALSAQTGTQPSQTKIARKLDFSPRSKF